MTTPRAAKLAEYNARRARIDQDTDAEHRGIAALEKAGHRATAAEMKLRLDRRIALSMSGSGSGARRTG